MNKDTNNNKTSSKWGKKTSEEVIINDFKNTIGDNEEIYKQVLLIKDKLSLYESLEEQVIMLMKNVFLIYSKSGVKQKIIHFEYLFSNCYKSRRVHNTYQRLKDKNEEIVNGTYTPTKWKQRLLNEKEIEIIENKTETL